MGRWRAQKDRGRLTVKYSEVVNCIAILAWALKRHMCGLAQIPALSLGTSASKVLAGRFFKSSEVVNFWGSELMHLNDWLVYCYFHRLFLPHVVNRPELTWNKANNSPGLQESRLCHVQGPASRNPMGDRQC